MAKAERYFFISGLHFVEMAAKRTRLIFEHRLPRNNVLPLLAQVVRHGGAGTAVRRRKDEAGPCPGEIEVVGRTRLIAPARKLIIAARITPGFEDLNARRAAGG